ncbi:MAG: FtsW/RodA/SpoVE family cell cycle protein [Cellulomonadaceae bacterium]|jgi:cell division protein FtsW (lipid II flippase)|nr:FtsW/RodA/SpoVE family cell cycle protein [Cellulomonadaceae bacterium]
MVSDTSSPSQATPEDLTDIFGAEPTFKKPWRIAEIFLLLLALGIGIGGFAMVGYVMNGELPDTFWLESASMVGIALFMHLVIRFVAPWADQIILPAVVLVNALGIVMILRLDLAPAGAAGANAIRQTQWAAVSVVVAAAVLIILREHRTLRRFTYTSGIVGLILLLSPMIPGLGMEINGARIWIQIAGMSIQPGEFAKIFLAIFFAGYFFNNRDNLTLAGPKLGPIQFPRFRDLGPILIVWVAAIAVLVMQSDMGMSLMLFGLFVAMLYLATQRFSWVLIGFCLVGAGGYFAVQAFPHVSQRFDGWLHAMDPAVIDRAGGSFQLVSGLFGLANGGLLGTGLGHGHPYLVPLSFSDFIYSSLGEELGLTGLLAVLVVFFLIVERGLRTAIDVRDGFGKVLAGGLAFLIAWQLFIIVGGVTRLLPLTGLTVPFMAQGGTSLLSNWIVIAILIRISNEARRPSIDPGLGEVAPVNGDESQGYVVVGQSDTPAIVSGSPSNDATEMMDALPRELPPDEDATEMIAPVSGGTQ